MSAQNIVIGIVALLVVASGAYLLLSSQSNSEDSMMEDDESAMIEEKTADETMQKDDVATPKDDTMSPTGQVEKGSYEAYSPEKLALASKGKVVLYFHADWCPICRGIEREIAAAPEGIPSGVHILKIDYDTATELKQKYGVTYQHTFVQVDAEGKELAKWGDATTLVQVVSKIR
ncbi:thioredoxin family protein [Candidatus Kaiserbacteria bacterium]|nr:thioredoxin family protein [Candidatus Kaiserbacteria bacterium]